MKVNLINYTQDALDLLLRTKNTRLKFDSDIASWPEKKKLEHIAYMRDTIKSSWEFVSYVFEITEVTRSFTHQLVRTRTGAYAQESQRTVDVGGNGWLNPINPTPVEPYVYNADAAAKFEVFDRVCRDAFEGYRLLQEMGVPAQDARDLLPNGTLTSITAKFDLRTLHNMALVRLCTRTQGLYQSVFRAMRAAVIAVHPWVEEFGFIEVNCVSTGTCAFPRYGKTSCQIYDPRMDQSAVINDTFKKFWAIAPQVAVPVAKNGKTM